MTERASCWSLTINNPTVEDLNPTLPAGWSMTGQIEVGGEKGTEHYQGMITTPQVRFSAVKKVFPRAHIEPAKNRSALQKYVHKDDTRVGEVQDRKSAIPTLFDYQHTVAAKWNDEDWKTRLNNTLEDDPKADIGETALAYVDTIVAQDIEMGMIGVEYIAINPMWRSAWKKFWKQMVFRERQKMEADKRQTDRQTGEEDEKTPAEISEPLV